MGSPEDEAGRRDNEDQVLVSLTRGFWMGKYEVTQKQWDDVMKASLPNPSQFKGQNLPVECVTHGQATQFCERLTKVASATGQLPQGWEFRLPTEANGNMPAGREPGLLTHSATTFNN